MYKIPTPDNAHAELYADLEMAKARILELELQLAETKASKGDVR